ncbi:MAG: hypothetical protein AAB434_11675 [Planctomycetota bacterium]
MGRAILACLLAAPLLAQDLKIENLRLMESEHGLPKREATVAPGENLVLLFDVAGLKREGVSMTLKLTLDVVDPAGATAHHWESDETRATDLLGGASQPGSVWYGFPTEAMKGTYTAKVTVEDVATRAQATASVQVTLADARLSVVNLGLTSDPTGQLPHGRVLVEREVVFVDFFVAGLKIVEGKARFQEDLVLLDEGGSVVGWLPNAVEQELKMLTLVAPVQNRLTLPRAGKYRVKVVVRDLNAEGTKAEHVLPIEVVPAPK